MTNTTSTPLKSDQYFEFKLWCSLLDWFIDKNDPNQPPDSDSQQPKESSELTSLCRELMGYFILLRISILLGGWMQQDFKLENHLDLELDPNNTIGNFLTTALFTIYIAIFLFEFGIMLKNKLNGSGQENNSIPLKQSFLKNFRFENIFYALIYAPINIIAISLKATDVLAFTPTSLFVFGLCLELSVMILRHDVEQKKLTTEINALKKRLDSASDDKAKDDIIKKINTIKIKKSNIKTNTEIAIATQAILITGFSIKAASSIMLNFFDLNNLASLFSSVGSLVLSAAFIGFNLAKIGFEIKKTWDCFSEANKLLEDNGLDEKTKTELKNQKALALSQLFKAFLYHSALIGVYATALLTGPIGGLCAMASVLALQFAFKGLKLDKKMDEGFKHVGLVLFSNPTGGKEVTPGLSPGLSEQLKPSLSF